MDKRNAKKQVLGQLIALLTRESLVDGDWSAADLERLQDAQDELAAEFRGRVNA